MDPKTSHSNLYSAAPPTINNCGKDKARHAALCLLCLPWFLFPVFAQENQPPPTCSTQIQWTNCGAPTPGAPLIELNLFSAVSKPADQCLPAEIRLTVTFLDEDQQVLCSGIVDNTALQQNQTQSTNLEIRPNNTLEFVKWKNGPRPVAVRPKRLVCMNTENLAEVAVANLERASQMQLFATILPKNGGVSSAECRVGLGR